MLCWHCEKEQMEEEPKLGTGWLKCPKCGATWIKTPDIKKTLRKTKK